MVAGVQNGIAEARALHRAGRLDEARGAYRSLLGRSPGDAAELRGLLGVIDFQQGRLGEAEALLRSALASGGDARIRLRNLNNLLALLQRSGDAAGARALIAHGVPDWPAGTVPNAAERGTVLSLCTALLLLGEAAAARELLDQALPARHDDPEASGLEGRILLALGEAEAAATALERSGAENGSEPVTLIALGYVQGKLGRAEAARETLGMITRRWPIHAPAQHPGQRARILVLNPTPEKIGNPASGLHGLHHTLNFAAQFARAMQDEFHFISVIAELPAERQPQSLPPADVVLNNCVNAEALNVPGRLDRVRATLALSDAPVINDPEAAAATTRQRVAELLQGIPGLHVPRIVRYRTDSPPVETLAADIESRFAFPVILRQCRAHTSAKLQYSASDRVSVLVEDGAALRSHLATLGWPEIYAIEYVPLRRPDGHFRKIRAVLAQDDVIIAIPGFNIDWMVAGGPGNPNWDHYYRAHPDMIEECRRIVRNPEGCLGADCLRTLEAIRDRMPLDLFGVDFDVDEDGQMVLFEANASMNLLKRANEPSEMTLPDEPFERIKAAFRRAVDRHLSRSA